MECTALNKPPYWVEKKPEWVEYPGVFEKDIVVISDLHLGMAGESYRYPHKQSLLNFLDRCHRSQRIGMVIFNGDIFDNWAHPSNRPAVQLSDVIGSVSLSWFQEKIVEVTSSRTSSGQIPPLKCVFVRGNHDDDLTAELLARTFVLAPIRKYTPSTARLRLAELDIEAFHYGQTTSRGDHIVGLSVKRISVPESEPAEASPPQDLPLDVQDRVATNLIFGGDVFFLRSSDGFLVFTHGHLGDVWNCRYWTNQKEPVGRFVTALACTHGVFSAEEGTGVAESIGLKIAGAAFPTLLVEVFDAWVKKLVDAGMKKIDVPRRARDVGCQNRWEAIKDQLWGGEGGEFTHQDVYDSLKVDANPTAIRAASAVVHFGSVPRLGAKSVYMWKKRSDSLFRVQLTRANVRGDFPELLMEMFLPGAVGIFTGHVHGEGSLGRARYEQYGYVSGNSGDWHPTSTKLTGIHIMHDFLEKTEQEEEGENYQNSYCRFQFQNGDFIGVGPPVRLTKIEIGQDRHWYHGEDGCMFVRPSSVGTFGNDEMAESVFDSCCGNSQKSRYQIDSDRFVKFRCRGHARGKFAETIKGVNVVRDGILAIVKELREEDLGRDPSFGVVLSEEKETWYERILTTMSVPLEKRTEVREAILRCQAFPGALVQCFQLLEQ